MLGKFTSLSFIFITCSLTAVWSQSSSFYHSLVLTPLFEYRGIGFIGNNKIAPGTPAYEIVSGEDGRPTEIVYHRGHRFQARSAFGAGRIKFSYSSTGYIIRSYYAFNDDQPAPRLGTLIYKERIKLNRDGLPSAIFFYNRQNQFASNENGVSSYIWELDSLGHKTRMFFLDKQGQRIRSSDGVGGYAYTYYSSGLVKKKTAINLSNLPSPDARGVLTTAYTYTKFGQVARIIYTAASGEEQKLSPKRPYSEILYKYDSKGLLREVQYLHNGHLTMNKHRVALMRYSYDQLGNPVSLTQYDDSHRMTLDDHHISKYAWRYYSQDNEVEQDNFDTLGNPVQDIYGVQSYRRSYDSKENLLEERFYAGPSGSISPNSEGVGMYLYRYDARSNLVQQQNYTASKDHHSYVLTPDINGVTIYRWTFDASGDKVSEKRYDKENRLVAGRSGIAQIEWGYDHEHNPVYEKHLGAYGQLKLSSVTKVAAIRRVYDHYYLLKEVHYLGIDEQPTENNLGIALLKRVGPSGEIFKAYDRYGAVKGKYILQSLDFHKDSWIKVSSSN